MTGPGAHLRRLDCLNIKILSRAKKSLSADAIQTKDHTLNMVGVYSNTASAIEAVRKKSRSCRGPISGDVLES